MSQEHILVINGPNLNLDIFRRRAAPLFLGARVLVGSGASPSETIAVQVVADLFFLHERGIWVGFSMAAAFFRTFIGPVIAGAMGERYGWRSFFWLSLGRSGFIMLLNLACFPETMYHRAAEVVAE
ncbi:hypothetical protein H2204_008812 [Knufia peltigerae]|uniref:Major facilitator superfamily (MFS) profile domain-containing protein n=1 Tax=Knufia peltigerae TaxID=1002370 RepID=A0AA38XZ70_9EURO|nr:hypothetical protein H2204_008812 [Knufia peltigerae]